MKKWIVIPVCLAAMATAGVFIFTGQANPVAKPGIYRVHRQDLRRAAFARGRVESATELARLSFEVSGRLVDVKVKAGQRVAQGDLLAELDAERFDLAIAEAEAVLQEKKAHLEQLKQGPRPEDIQQAQQRVNRALLDVKTAELRLQQLQQPERHPSQKWQIDEAQQKLALATYQMNAAINQQNKTLSPPTTPDLAVTEAEIELRESEFEGAERLYKALTDKYGSRVPKAERVKMLNQIANKKAAVQAAQRRHDKVKAGASTFDKEAAKFGAHQAKISRDLALAQYQRLQSPPPLQPALPTQIELAKVALEQAKTVAVETRAALKQMQAGALPSNLKAAEAAVARAEQGVAQAEARRKLVMLKAPFDGVITRRMFEPGTTPAPYTPILELTDLDHLRVRTEINVEWAGDLKLKQQAALLKTNLIGKPGIPGHVARVLDRIGPKTLFSDDPTETKGGEVAVALIEIAKPTEEHPIPDLEVLRPGLRLDVRIDFDSRDNVLAVPLSYVGYADGKHVVYRAKSYDKESTAQPETEEVEVELGFKDLLNVEILRGLNEGDIIVKPLRYR